jgi:hypothetical protein
MQSHFGFFSRDYVPSEISHRYLALNRPDIKKRLDFLIVKRNIKTFCLNDVQSEVDSASKVDALLKSFFEEYYPFKSSFEL